MQAGRAGRINSNTIYGMDYIYLNTIYGRGGSL